VNQKTTTPFSTLQAGVSQVDITPWEGVQLAGDVGAYRPAKYVLDPLYVHAVVFETAECKVCILAADLCVPVRKYLDSVRQAAGVRLGIKPEAIITHLTQTHSAPGLGHFMLSEDYPGIPPDMDWLRGGDSHYSDWVVERMIEAACLANDAMQPVQLGVGSGIEGRLAHNRRAITKDGSILMPGPSWPRPLGPTQIRYLEGPIDPEVGVICLRNNRLELPTIITNYSCHPVHVFPKPIISADWPGALTKALAEKYGAACQPMVLNGCCGNINPWDPFDPGYKADHQRMGRMLADTVGQVLDTLEFQHDIVLDYRSKHLAIPQRAPDAAKLAWAHRMLADHPVPLPDATRPGSIDFNWVQANSVLDLAASQQHQPLYDYEIQAVRLGNTAIVGLPGEPFVEGQLRLKLESKAPFTYVAHDTASYVGYLPIPEAFQRGGHEANTGNWSRLVPEALDRVVDEAAMLVNEMF
jgi:neutral ceramidase